MSPLRKGDTLFDAVPAIGAISAHGTGTAKLMPVGFDHPGFVLAEGVNRIGRDPAQNQHVMLSTNVSRSHCEVFVSEGQVWVSDLGSHNGTYVNDQRIGAPGRAQQELKPGDRLGLSRKVTFVLAMDAELEKPIGVEMNLDAPAPSAPGGAAGRGAAPGRREATRDEESGLKHPAGASARVAVREPTAALPAVSSRPAARPLPPTSAVAVIPLSSHDVVAIDDGELDVPAQLRQVEQQRNVLAILYQISLRCLLAENARESEKLLTNVLQRLVPMDAGFILYQSDDVWRASICPGTRRRPSDATVRAFYRLAIQQRAPIVVREPADLQAVGLEEGSALVAPMLLNDAVTGVVGAISGTSDAFSAETVDILAQLANVSAAALRSR